LVHLFQKNSLARFLGGERKSTIGESSLFHASILSSHGLERQGFAEFP
jgi:hypothetical protein